MKILAIGSFFLLFVIVSIAAVPSVFAVEIEPIEGSGTPGCEETPEGCWTVMEAVIDVGGEVTWINTDAQPHTVTSGADLTAPDVGELFDSGLQMNGDSFSWTFDTAGEYPYFCMVHPWMVGTVIVGEAMAEEEEEETMEEVMMSGVNLDLDIDPMLPFDNTVNDMVTLSFTAKSDVLKGSEGFDHLDYKVVISKDGNEVWSEQFHDHDANLELQFTPSDGSFTTTGGEEVGSSETKAFMIEGPVFMDNGDYQISGQIVGIEFNPLSTPLIDDFNMKVVPEFGTITMVILTVGIFSVIAVTAKSRVIPRL